MLNQDREKYLICSRLLAGESATDIAADFDNVSYPTILRYKRELNEAQDNGTVADFLNIEEAILAEMVEELKNRAPVELKQEVNEAVGNLVNSKNALEALSLDLIVTASAVNKKIRAKVVNVEHVSELESLTESLCKLQNAFFNKPLTQVNVQNNYDANGSNTYSNWLSDQGAE